MGATGYPPGYTAAEAKADTLRNTTPLFQSGNWYARRTSTGDLFAVYLKVVRYGQEISVKAIVVSAGPFEVPSEAFYRRWVATAEAEPGYRVSDYEQDWRARCEAKYAAKARAGAIKVGDTFETVEHLVARVIKPAHKSDRKHYTWRIELRVIEPAGGES